MFDRWVRSCWRVDEKRGGGQLLLCYHSSPSPKAFDNGSAHNLWNTCGRSSIAFSQKYSSSKVTFIKLSAVDRVSNFKRYNKVSRHKYFTIWRTILRMVSVIGISLQYLHRLWFWGQYLSYPVLFGSHGWLWSCFQYFY